MIEALKADLQALSDAMPVLTQRIAHAVEGAEALSAAAQELQQEVDTARAEASAELQAVRDALPSLAVQVGADGKQIEGAAAAASQAWSNAEGGIEVAGEKVANQADELVANTHDLIARIAEVGTKIDQSEAIGDAALAQLAQQGHDADERLRAAMQTLQAEIAQVKQLTASAKETLTAAAQGLWSRLKTITSEGQDGAQQALQAMHERADPIKEAAQDLVATLEQQVMERVDASDGQIAALVAPLDEAQSLLRVELERLSADAGGYEQTLAQHGQALEVAAGRAQSESNAVPADIAAIQQAAHELGLLT